MMRALVLLPLACLLAACATPVNTTIQASILLARDREFSQASEQLGAAEAFRRFLAPDALQLPDGGEPIRGRDSIAAGLQKIRGERVLRWFPMEALVGSGGDLGYTWGNWELVQRTSGVDVIAARGKYVNVWRRGPGGRWEVLVDTGNDAPGSDPAPPPAALPPGGP
ncbi:MAG: DUF4440 domain-containing protein [Gammaproteobacteria bacterium]|jgi:ketosteroid isomerase-like protein|nr:DUF4440 domain-containing protein [Gammaproteobacteria bacterium]